MYSEPIATASAVPLELTITLQSAPASAITCTSFSVSVIPGAAVTGFSGAEVDVSVSAEIPCPLHWMLASGENGRLVVMQNRNGEAMEIVRETDIPLGRVPQEALDEIRHGKVFDDVQALEGYLESLSS